MNPPPLSRAIEITLDRFSHFTYTPPTTADFKQFCSSILVDFTSSLLLTTKQSHPNHKISLIGPSLIVLSYSFTVCWGQFYVLFWVFSTWLFGSLLIFLLFRLLGSSRDLLQVAASIGYASAPLVLLEPLMTVTEEPLPKISIGIKCIAVFWAARSASFALVQVNTEKKIFLFEFPLILFNVYWLSLRSGA
jgi:hypothetical protein